MTEPGQRTAVHRARSPAEPATGRFRLATADARSRMAPRLRGRGASFPVFRGCGWLATACSPAFLRSRANVIRAQSATMGRPLPATRFDGGYAARSGRSGGGGRDDLAGSHPDLIADGRNGPRAVPLSRRKRLDPMKSLCRPTRAKSSTDGRGSARHSSSSTQRTDRGPRRGYPIQPSESPVAEVKEAVRGSRADRGSPSATRRPR